MDQIQENVSGGAARRREGNDGPGRANNGPGRQSHERTFEVWVMPASFPKSFRPPSVIR
jgi:hypothetical protein